eukprot:360591-Chlamydomonas_euryale.AAC.18
MKEGLRGRGAIVPSPVSRCRHADRLTGHQRISPEMDQRAMVIPCNSNTQLAMHMCLGPTAHVLFSSYCCSNGVLLDSFLPDQGAQMSIPQASSNSRLKPGIGTFWMLHPSPAIAGSRECTSGKGVLDASPEVFGSLTGAGEAHVRDLAQQVAMRPAPSSTSACTATLRGLQGGRCVRHGSPSDVSGVLSRSAAFTRQRPRRPLLVRTGLACRPPATNT